MKDSIHNKLIGHIRKTMGQYEPPYESGSWEEFQRQQRSGQRKPLLWFRYAMAACLLLGVLGVPAWLYIDRLNLGEQVHNHRKVDSLGKKSLELPISNRPPTALVVPDQTNPIASTKKTPSQKNNEWKNAGAQQSESHPKRSDVSSLAVSNHPLKSDTELTKTGFLLSAEHLPDGHRDERQAAQLKESTSQSGIFEKINFRSKAVYRWSTRPMGLPLNVKPEAYAMRPINRPQPEQKPIWGLSLVPQSVYAAGTLPSAAIGGGMFSEIPLNRRFSLSTGLSMAQQTLATRESGRVLSTIPQLVSTDIRLVAVDLPVNIRFRPAKSSGTGFYIETGLSSVAFLNEQYAYTYQQTKPVTVLVMGTNGQEQVVTQYVTSQETTNRSEPAFQKIYWGRIVNLSVGIERRISDRFRLSAEPYLKYPIGPFTRANLSLGSGGVSLRLGFQSGR